MDLKNSKSLSSSNTGNATNPQQSGERRVTLNLSRLHAHSTQQTATTASVLGEKRDAELKAAHPNIAQAKPDAKGITPAATAKVQPASTASNVQSHINGKLNADGKSGNSSGKVTLNLSSKLEIAATTATQATSNTLAKGDENRAHDASQDQAQAKANVLNQDNSGAQAANKANQGKGANKGSKTPPWMAQYLKKAEETKQQEQVHAKAKQNVAQLENSLTDQKRKNSELLARQKKLDDELKAKHERLEKSQAELLKLAAQNSFELNFLNFQTAFNDLDDELNKYLIEQYRFIDTEIQNGNLPPFKSLKINEETLNFLTPKKAKYKHKKLATEAQINEEISKYLRFKYCGLFKALCLYKFFCENFKLELFNQLENRCQEYCSNISNITMPDLQRLIDDVEPLDVAANKLMRLALADGKQLYQQLFHDVASKRANQYDNTLRAEGLSLARASTFRADQLPSVLEDEFDSFFVFWNQMHEQTKQAHAEQDQTQDQDPSQAQISEQDQTPDQAANQAEDKLDSEDKQAQTGNMNQQVSQDAAALAAGKFKHVGQRQAPHANANLAPDAVATSLFRERFQNMFPETLDPKAFAEQLNEYDHYDGLYHFANKTLQELNTRFSVFDGFSYSKPYDIIDEALLNTGYEWLNKVGTEAASNRNQTQLEWIFYARLHDLYVPYFGLSNPNECIEHDGYMIACCPEANFKRNALQLDQLSRQLVYLRKYRATYPIAERIVTHSHLLYPEYAANLAENDFSTIVRFVLNLSKPERFIFHAMLDKAKENQSLVYITSSSFNDSKVSELELNDEEYKQALHSLCDKLKNSIIVNLVSDEGTKHNDDSFVFNAVLNPFVSKDIDRIQNLIKMYSTVKALDERMNLELQYMNPSLRLMFECNETLRQGFKKDSKRTANNYMDSLVQAIRDERLFGTFRNRVIDEYINISETELNENELTQNDLIPQYFRKSVIMKAFEGLESNPNIEPSRLKEYFDGISSDDCPVGSFVESNY